MPHRFFVTPDVLSDGVPGAEVRLTGATAHQLVNVLRLRPSERIVLLDGAGWEYEVELTALNREAVTGRVARRALATGEPRLKLTLYQGLPRGAKFELVLQKGTEIGISAFVPLVTRRSVVSSLAAASELKLDRWHRILTEAAEQAGRARVPALGAPVLFQQACEAVTGLSLMPWEGERRRALRTVIEEQFGGRASAAPFSVNLFIGPEGGFEPDEVEQARGYGILPVTLGPRILRTETAGLATAATLLYVSGDFG